MDEQIPRGQDFPHILRLPCSKVSDRAAFGCGPACAVSEPYLTVLTVPVHVFVRLPSLLSCGSVPTRSRSATPWSLRQSEASSAGTQDTREDHYRGGKA